MPSHGPKQPARNTVAKSLKPIDMWAPSDEEDAPAARTEGNPCVLLPQVSHELNSTQNQTNVEDEESKDVPADDEDDYMTMVLEEPTKAETSLQRAARLRRERESRGQPKSKAQVAEEQRRAREQALDRSSLTDPVSGPQTGQSKAAKIMAKLGYTTGSGLGKHGREDVALEPIKAVMKNDRTGVGRDNEAKRKIRERAEAMQNGDEEAVVTEADFRSRKAREAQEKHLEAQHHAAMKIAEELDAKDGNGEDLSASKPLAAIPLLWRSLVRDRREKERAEVLERTRYNNLSQTYGDQESIDDLEKFVVDEDEDEREDDTLVEHNALPLEQRLKALLMHMREHHWYCFWCKATFPDEQMEGCPGLSEDDHA